MAAMTAAKAVETAISETFTLHPRLMSFFARYPPELYSSLATGQKIPTLKQRVAMNSKPLSSTSLPTSIPGEEETTIATTSTTQSQPQTEPIHLQTISETSLSTTSSTATTKTKKTPQNPFLPWKNPNTGRWAGAKLGLRQQADLFKLAREYEVEDLLPPSIKSTEYKRRRALERGLAVKGTGEDQQVKGHQWERQIGVTMEKRRVAMEEMPEMIRLWKERGHGRGWKKYPK